jgi:hypothetical protein
VQSRTSMTDWHKQQYFSHSHSASIFSHCMQRCFAVPVPVLMKLGYRPRAGRWNVTEVIKQG